MEERDSDREAALQEMVAPGEESELPYQNLARRHGPTHRAQRASQRDEAPLLLIPRRETRGTPRRLGGIRRPPPIPRPKAKLQDHPRT